MGSCAVKVIVVSAIAEEWDRGTSSGWKMGLLLRLVFWWKSIRSDLQRSSLPRKAIEPVYLVSTRLCRE
jgi:hypothetical protein